MKSLVSPFHLRLPFTVPLALRYVFITLLLTGFVLGAWSGITPVAHAASHSRCHHGQACPSDHGGPAAASGRVSTGHAPAPDVPP